MGIPEQQYMMIKRDKETQKMFDKVHSMAMLYGMALMKYDTVDGFSIIDPDKYDELIAALNWSKENRVKL